MHQFGCRQWQPIHRPFARHSYTVCKATGSGSRLEPGTAWCTAWRTLNGAPLGQPVGGNSWGTVPDWPFKSPDLNQIEPIWYDQKDVISTYQLTGASQITIRQARATLVRVWKEFPQALIDRRCGTFRGKLERCILHGGNNNYDC